MEVALHPLTNVYGGRMAFPFAEAKTLGRVYSEVLRDAPDELQVYLDFGTGAAGKSASVILCDCGDSVVGEAAHGRFQRELSVLSDEVTRTPYLQLQQHWDDTFPEGRNWYWKSSFLAEITEEVVRLCAEAVGRQELPDCSVDFEPMGGAISRIAPDATAFADRDAASTLLITTTWTDPREAEARIKWVRETWAALQPYCKASAYINYLDQGDEGRAEAAYGASLERLAAVKQTYDPENVFRATGSIRP